MRFEDAFSALDAVLAEWRGSRESIEVLEAGGGSLSKVNFNVPAHVTVVDLSQEQLDNNDVADVKILGDLHTIDLGRDRFDAAVIWDVIEHLDQPRLVLHKLLDAVKSGGLIVIAAPNPRSLSAAVTKYTPFAFHVLVHRHLFKNKMAGRPGYAPFPTVHHADILPDQICRMAGERGADVLLRVEYESSRRAHLKTHSPVAGLLYDGAVAVGNLLTRRKMQHSDFIIVLKAA